MSSNKQQFNTIESTGIESSPDRGRPTSIAEAPVFARTALTTEFGATRDEDSAYDQFARNKPTLLSGIFAGTVQKAVWQKEQARMDMVGKARCERLRIAHEVTLRVLATAGEAMVKAAQVGIAREFFGYAQQELTNMAINTESSRKRFMHHIEDREATLATLPARLKVPYERSLDNEILQHFEWLDAATQQLLERLQEKVVGYAGAIDG